MQIEWKSEAESPYISVERAEWNGVRVHRATVLPGRMLEHESECHEVSVNIAGTLTTEKRSATGRLIKTTGTGGNICITPSGQSISAHWDKPLDNLGFALDSKFVSDVAAENGFSRDVEFIEVYKKKDPLIQSLGISLLESASAVTSLGRLYADSLIQTLTLHLLSNYTTAFNKPAPKSGGLSGYKLRRVTEYIDARLDEEITLNELAAVAELSSFHFVRAFRKSTGKTPQQFLMHRRVERAKELLSRPDLPIVEVGLRTGFKNQSHFTTLFRKYTNFTPKIWREIRLA